VSRLARLIRHGLSSHAAARRLFPAEARQRIRAATAAAEEGHSGEIRFAFENTLPLSYLWRHASPRERAVRVFAELGTWDTEHNNGVLIYVLLADRGVEIVADRGIARRVAADRWEAVSAAMRAEFSAGRYEQGAVLGIAQVGRLLAEHFPLASGKREHNELSDRPVEL